MHHLKRSALILLTFAATLLAHAQLRWMNPQDVTYPVITGRAWHTELAGTYARLPERAKAIVRPDVWNLSRQSAGLGIDFYTNSPQIVVRYHINGDLAMPHMPATGVSGIDLYATDKDGNLRWCAATPNFHPAETTTPAKQGAPSLLGRAGGEAAVEASFTSLEYPNARKERGYNYHLSLPLYNEVTSMEIGVDSAATFAFLPVTTEDPIVIYGTSISQGACASRPGLAWTNILQRETGHEIINLGFSGNALAEPELFDLMAEIHAKAYVIACMPNMCNAPELAVLHDRIVAGVKRLRRDSDAPILLVEHAGYTNESTSPAAKEKYDAPNRELLRALQTLKAEGIEGLHYMPHDTFGLGIDDMVEGIHPNDLGMRKYADAYRRTLDTILHEDSYRRSVFTPLTQQRDPYDWQQRHRRVLQINREEPPKVILIGNSITHYWAGLPTARLVRGEDSWENLWHGTAHNLGFGWDRIENALWRIYHGELDGYSAEKVLLLLGTNNIDYNSDAEIADGIMEVVRAVRHRQPRAHIYICGVLPRADRFSRIAPLNRAIQQALFQSSLPATYLDLSPAVLNADGTLRSELFSDGLHPTREGYQAIAERLQELLGGE